MGIELFERTVSGGGQLLRVDVSPLGGGAGRVAALMLTFDLGRITVTAEPATGALLIDYVDSPEHTPGGLQDASEEEPWWRLLGALLARAWPAGDDPHGAVCIQFRADGQSARTVILEPRGPGVSIKLENSQLQNEGQK